MRRFAALGMLALLWLGLFSYKRNVSIECDEILDGSTDSQLRIAKAGHWAANAGSSIIRRRDIDVSSEALPLEATLRDRLDVWRNAPGGRGDVLGEVEPGQFVQWNLEVS
jgi:hypothetical protein